MTMRITNQLLCLTLLCSIHIPMALSTDFAVGNEKGWAIPSANDPNAHHFYNEWASKNRFKVNDTLKFEYENDSIMVVTQEEYEKCKSAHPIFYSNDHHTVYRLDRSGLYYFISGISGHCERGLKMIVKVLDVEAPPQSNNQTAGDSAPPQAVATGGAVQLAGSPVGLLGLLFVSLLGTIFSIM